MQKTAFFFFFLAGGEYGEASFSPKTIYKWAKDGFCLYEPDTERYSGKWKHAISVEEKVPGWAITKSYVDCLFERTPSQLIFLKRGTYVNSVSYCRHFRQISPYLFKDTCILLVYHRKSLILYLISLSYNNN